MRDIKISICLILLCGLFIFCLSGCGEVIDDNHYPNDAARGEIEASKVKSTTRFSRNYLSGNFLTVKHDNHLWIVYYGVGFVHSPDCPCLKKEFNEIPNY